MITEFIKTIFSIILKLVMYPIIFGSGLALLIYCLLSFKKDKEIKNIVFNQAYNEKYDFKNYYLKNSSEDWIRNKIKSGEIK